MQDPLDKEGLAHLLEHLMFKRPNCMEQLEAMGLWNASTTHEATMYYVKTTVDKCEDAAKLMFEMCSSLPVITEADLKNELKIIAHEDASSSFKYLRLPSVDESFLEGSAYERNIIGSSHSLGRITLQDLHDFYHAYYQVGFFMMVGPREALIRIKNVLKSEVYASRICKNQMDGKLVPYAEVFVSKTKNAKKTYKRSESRTNKPNKKSKKKIKIYNMITKTRGLTLCKIGFKIEVPFSFKTYVALALVSYAIRCELFNVIREQMHATYTPTCKLRIYKGFFVMSITIICNKLTLVKCIDVAMETVAQLATTHVNHKANFVTKFNMSIDHNMALLLYAPFEMNEKLVAVGSRINVVPLLRHFKKHRCLMLVGHKPSLTRMRKAIHHF
jgi:secreted Zn-dependent insulinase-like peptidase